MAVVGRGGRDVARRVPTTGVKPRQQPHQRTVGLAPHEAVDGGQFRGRPFDRLRHLLGHPFDASTVLSDRRLMDLNTGDKGKQKQSYDEKPCFHACKDKKSRHKNLAAGKKCNTYEKKLLFSFYSSSFWLSSYSFSRRFWTSVGTC